MEKGKKFEKRKRERYCANCFVCRKDTFYCPLNEAYDQDKVLEILKAKYKGVQNCE